MYQQQKEKKRKEYKSILNKIELAANKINFTHYSC